MLFLQCLRRPFQTLLSSAPPCVCNSCSTSSNTSIPISNWLCFHQFGVYPMLFLKSSSKPIFKLHPCSMYSTGSASVSHYRVFKQTVNAENHEEETINVAELESLKQKVEVLGINSNSCTPGQYDHLICPKCKGGQSMERSLSFHITLSKDFAMWRCFRIECGWAGQVFADSRMTYNGVNKIGKLDSSRQVTEKSPKLEPLGDELIAYFSERMISKETLQKHAVMQMSGGQNIIAFTYRRNGVLVGCKYRSIDKKHWQDKGMEKILYGLDNIKEADEIIIVEGEIDKLSMEEAGICNCVSVPDGAPQKVSTKELPSLEKDIRFQYLWNCKEYLDKASRIILATDSDIPGQALAEELARRLGKERCWQVRWPRKDEYNCFKDANEVLKNLGSGALRNIIENADLYETHNFN